MTLAERDRRHCKCGHHVNDHNPVSRICEGRPHCDCKAWDACPTSAHVHEVLTPIKDHLRTARHLLKEHWSGQDNWWVGNEHTWLAQSDDEIRKAQALLDAAGT